MAITFFTGSFSLKASVGKSLSGEIVCLLKRRMPVFLNAAWIFDGDIAFKYALQASSHI